MKKEIKAYLVSNKIKNSHNLFETNGYIFIQRQDYMKLMENFRKIDYNDWDSFKRYWNYLVTDHYLRNIGKQAGKNYGTRKRRFLAYCYDINKDKITYSISDEFNQFRNYTDKNGNFIDKITQRKFALISKQAQKAELLKNIIKLDLLLMLTENNQKEKLWNGFIHFFRVYSNGDDDTGVPSPEGIHTDNHYFISMHLINKMGISGGESRIYDLEKKPIINCRLENCYDTILLKDHKLLHDVTPIRSIIKNVAGFRDMLIIDYRRGDK